MMCHESFLIKVNNRRLCSRHCKLTQKCIYMNMHMHNEAQAMQKQTPLGRLSFNIMPCNFVLLLHNAINCHGSTNTPNIFALTSQTVRSDVKFICDQERSNVCMSEVAS